MTLIHSQYCLTKKNFAYCIESPENMLREYVRGSEYSDIEKPRELLSKVTDEQKLDMLPQTTSELGGKLIR